MKKVRTILYLVLVGLLFAGCVPSMYTEGVEHSDFPTKNLPIYDNAIVFYFERDKGICELEFGSQDGVEAIMEYYKEVLEDEGYTIQRESDRYDDEYYVEGYAGDWYFEIDVEEASTKLERHFVTVTKIVVEPSEEDRQGDGKEDEGVEHEKKEKNVNRYSEPDGFDVMEMDQKRIKDFDWDSISEDIKTKFDKGMEYYDEGKYKRAFANFSECAEEGHPTAQGMLGECYYYGDGVDKDIDKAANWFKRGAWQGDEQSQYSLGFLYINGQGVKEDEDAGIYLVQCAANQGYLHAQLYLGWCYETGRIYELDYNKALFWYTKAADQGDVDAIVWIGEYNMYYEEGNTIYYKKAVEYFEKAVELEDSRGNYYLARCYYFGCYYDVDYEKAVEILKPALDDKDSRAQYMMGRMYYDGEGVEQDYEQAARYYKLSAEQGNIFGMNDYGDLYETGLGVEQDYDKAFYWYQRAAYYGDGMALYNVGHFYYEGWGVERDYETAVYYYNASAEQEVHVGQWGLGICYENGHGVEQDLSQAKYWYQLAADQGLEEAVEALKGLEAVEADTEPKGDVDDDVQGA